MGGEKLVIGRDLKMAYKWILKLPDDGMGLPVFKGCTKSDNSPFRPYFKAQVEFFAPDLVVIDENGICLLADKRLLVSPRDFDFLFFGSIVIQPPEGGSSCIVPSAKRELYQASGGVYIYLCQR